MQNYKVFINNRLIFFGLKEEIPTINYCLSDFQSISPIALPNIVSQIKSYSLKNHVIIETSDPENAFMEFLSHFEILHAAGGLVQNKKKEILMIHRFRKWDFPKGHLEANETISEGAIREVMEETGIDSAKVVSKLPCTYHIYSFNEEWIVKKSHWYLMSTNFEGSLVPQIEEDILAAVWVPLYALSEYLVQSYPALVDLVSHMESNHLFGEI